MARNQRVPVGFLELLGVKAAGLTLPQVAEYLQPTLEMADFYGSILWGTELAVAAAAAPPNNATLTVPQGELWFLNSVALTSNAQGAATEIAPRILVAPIGATGLGSVVAAKSIHDFTLAAPPFSFELAWQPPRPWILRPGATITGGVGELDVGTVQNILQALFYRVPF